MPRARKPKIEPLYPDTTRSTDTRCDVTSLQDANPYRELLRVEIEVIRRAAGFTGLQDAVFDLYTRNIPLVEIARRLSRSLSNVSQILARAKARAEAVIPTAEVGLISSVFETMGDAAGWELVGDILEKQEEAKRR